jgi:hypothetical protein
MSVFEPAPATDDLDRKTRTGEKLVLDPEGQPIRMADPTFTDEDWSNIQAALGDRTASGQARQMTPNPLGGIGYCGCGYALALHRRKSSSGKEGTHLRQVWEVA